jgi:hypothetical protein
MSNAVTWIGLFHVEPAAGNHALGGAIGAFVTVAATAEGEKQFLDIVSAALREAGFEISAAEDVEPWSTRIKNSRPEKEIHELVESLTTDNRVAFGDFYTYDAE